MGGVVTTTAGAGLDREIASRIGISAERFYEFCGRNTPRDMLSQLTSGGMTPEQFWAEFSSRSGICVRCDYWRTLFHPVRDEAVCALIRALRVKDRVVCGTNTIRSHYDNHVSRGDYAVFDQTYASFFMGAAKPDVRFWRLILDAEGVSAENAFFTDDTAENCAAAASLGIRTHLFKDIGGLRKAVAQWL